MEWTLRPGDAIRRTELHREFGGAGQGGMSPSRQSPNVMLFTDPKTGQQHGYYDGWFDDDRFHYSGEGQRGDQTMNFGNKALLNHREDQRSVRLFHGTGGIVRYLGEFEVDSNDPFHEAEAPESGGDQSELRRVYVFHLRPIGPVIKDAEDQLPARDQSPSVVVPVEQMNSECFITNPSAEPRESERREQALVLRYKGAMEAKGYEIVRTRLLPMGETMPIFTDVVDQSRRNLIEAKGTVTRGSIRMIIGQLADYSRFHSKYKLAALLPERPRPDLEALLTSQGIAVVWASGKTGFADNAGGAFS